MAFGDLLQGLTELVESYNGIITTGSLGIVALIILKYVFKTIKWGIIIALAIALVFLLLIYLQQ